MQRRDVFCGLAKLAGFALACALAVGAEASPSPQFCPVAEVGITPLAGRAVHSVKEFGAAGDGVTDDSVALQMAFDRVEEGAVVVLPAGTYVYSRSLRLSHRRVVVMGKGATLKARTPGDEALVLSGEGSALVGLTLKGAGGPRLTTPPSAQVVVSGRWVQVVGNSISEGASGGIFVFGGKDFRIAGNTVSNTKADGIHMTNGARRGVVEGNVVFGTGDDMIAVVSYRPSGYAPDNAGLSGDILIKNNRVSGNSWGRGISVVGGENVLITENKINNVWGAAGILVAQEHSFRTYGAKNVRIFHNIIADIQTDKAPVGMNYTDHGAIDVNTSGEAPVQSIVVEGNSIANAGAAGIRLLGNVCQVSLLANSLTAVVRRTGGNPIDLSHDTCPGTTIRCQGNSVDGKPVKPVACLSGPSGMLGEKDGPDEKDGRDLTTLGSPWASCKP